MEMGCSGSGDEFSSVLSQGGGGGWLIAHLGECLPGMHKATGSVPWRWKKPAIPTREVEAGGSRVQFKVNVGFMRS